MRQKFSDTLSEKLLKSARSKIRTVNHTPQILLPLPDLALEVVLHLTQESTVHPPIIRNTILDITSVDLDMDFSLTSNNAKDSWTANVLQLLLSVGNNSHKHHLKWDKIKRDLAVYLLPKKVQRKKNGRNLRSKCKKGRLVSKDNGRNFKISWMKEKNNVRKTRKIKNNKRRRWMKIMT